MPTVAKYVLDIIGKRELAAFEQTAQFVHETQQDVLLKIVELNQSCVYGNEHNFRNIHSVKDFQDNVPLNTYDSLTPYIEQATLGGKNILTREDPFLFATTSGTTGTPKYIPITKTSRNQKSAIMRLWLYSAQKDHPRLFDGKFLTLVSPEIEGTTKGGLPCGAESGHAYKNIPLAMRKQYAVPYEVFLIKDYDAKYYTLLRIAMEQDITFLGTCNPSTIILLAQKMDLYKHDIIRDIHDGTLSHKFDIADDIRLLLESGLKANPARAALLQNLTDTHTDLKPSHVWPHIALIGCWTGGNVGMYLKKMSDYFPDNTPIRDWGYLASELRGSLPLSDNCTSGVLTFTTNFYEFIPVDQIHDKNKPMLLAHELKAGERYYIYITTSAGLYRYDMNDIIQVDDVYQSVPVISFIQKGKGVSSLTGEKLYETQIIESVQKSLQEINHDLIFISAVAQIADPPYYAFLFEPVYELNTDTKQHLLTLIDNHLGRINMEYKSKRESQRLQAPQLKLTSYGMMEQYRKSRIAAGTPDGQFKMIHLTSDPAYLDHFSVKESISLYPHSSTSNSKE